MIFRDTMRTQPFPFERTKIREGSGTEPKYYLPFFLQKKETFCAISKRLIGSLQNQNQAQAIMSRLERRGARRHTQGHFYDLIRKVIFCQKLMFCQVLGTSYKYSKFNDKGVIEILKGNRRLRFSTRPLFLSSLYRLTSYSCQTLVGSMELDLCPQLSTFSVKSDLLP